MAAKRKPAITGLHSQELDKDIVRSIYGNAPFSDKVLNKAGREARKRASKIGTPVGPTRMSGGQLAKSPSSYREIGSVTTVYSRGGTGKGTTGKRAVVTEHKTDRQNMPDKIRQTVSRKLNKPRKKK